MKTIKVKFVKFWKGWQLESYVFLDLLRKKYLLKIVNDNPDFLIFADRITSRPSNVERLMSSFKCVKVFYSGENTRTNPNIFDFSFTQHETNETNFQMLNFSRCGYYFDFINQNKPKESSKVKFCNFIYRNRGPKERIRFCNKLMKYKHVDCPGEVLNNMQNFTREGRRSLKWLSEKVAYIGKYKFTIAFENDSARNYVTEKIFDSFYAGSIPIYWGAPNVSEFFDSRSFVNVRDFRNYDEVIRYVREIDNNDELYKQMRSIPPIHEGSKLKACTEESVLRRFDRIVEEVERRKAR